MNSMMEADTLARLVAYTAKVARDGGKTISIYAGRETLRPVRALADEPTYDQFEVLCGRIWRRAYVEPFGLGKLYVGSGSRARGRGCCTIIRR